MMRIPKTFERSFASHFRAICWSPTNFPITPRDVFKSSNKLYKFDCDVCPHCFETTLSNVSNEKQPHWCPYCSNSKLCKNEECKECLAKSFASHEKHIFWSAENKGLQLLP